MVRRAQQARDGLTHCPSDVNPKVPSGRCVMAPISILVTLIPFALVDLVTLPLLVVYQDHHHYNLHHQNNNNLNSHTLHTACWTVIKTIQLDKYYILRQRKLYNRRPYLVFDVAENLPPSRITNDSRF